MRGMADTCMSCFTQRLQMDIGSSHTYSHALVP
jgi:hypothetical protein